MSVKFWEKKRIPTVKQGPRAKQTSSDMSAYRSQSTINKSNGTEAQAKLSTVKKQPDNAIVYWE